MFRRLLAALLVAAVAMPIPAVATAATKPCPMAEHAAMGPGHRCCCNDSQPAPAYAGCSHAAAPATSGGRCDCVVKADPGERPVAPATPSAPTFAKQPFAHSTLLPAALSTPRRQPRAVHVADPPPAVGVVSRPGLCTWIL